MVPTSEDTERYGETRRGAERYGTEGCGGVRRGTEEYGEVRRERHGEVRRGTVAGRYEEVRRGTEGVRRIYCTYTQTLAAA